MDITYIVQNANGYKIGYTSDFRSRMSQLRTAAPDTTPIAIRPGNIEKKLHEILSAKRTVGEFFRMAEREVDAVIHKFRFVRLCEFNQDSITIKSDDISRLVLSISESAVDRIILNNIDTIVESISERVISAINGELSNLFCKNIEDIGGGLQKIEKSDSSEDFLTRVEVCNLLHISKVTFHDWVNKGMLQPIKVGNRTLIEKQPLLDSIRSGNIGRYVHQK